MRDQPTAPHDPATEAALIGAALLRPDTIDEAVDAGLEPDHLYNPAHRLIWRACLALHYHPGHHVDATSVATRLGPDLDNIGGPATLTTLQANCPSTSGTTGRVATIREKAARRTAANIADQLRTDALTGTNWTDHLDRLTRLATTPDTTAPPPPIRWVHNALDTPPPEPPELVEGFLRCGDLTAIAAPRKIGKSWTAMNLAICLSRGHGLFLGTLPVLRQAKTLIVQGELDEWGSYSRWTHLTGGDKTDLDGIAETFAHWRVRSQLVREDDSHEGKRTTVQRHIAVLDPDIERTIVAEGFEVLIIDPWAVFFAGNENNNDEVEQALSELRQLSLRTGVAVVIVHHVGKATESRDPEDLWRGASRFPDWVSTGLTMMPHWAKKDGKGGWGNVPGMTRQKARWYVDLFFMRRGRPTDDFSIRWDPATGWWDTWDPNQRSAMPAPPNEVAPGRAWNPPDVALLLAQTGPWGSYRAAVAAFKDAGGPGHRAARRYLDAAISSGLIEEYQGADSRSTAFRLTGHPETWEAAPNFFDDGTTPDDWEHLAVDPELVMEDAP